ncbi:MAG: cobalamin-binding protein [Firmicutes bacterium]|nr:cobalamin-binding protein [Bacillota bacterium]
MTAPEPARIVSLLPSATEILFALGLGDAVRAVTHECDFPPEAKSRRVLVRPAFDPHRLKPREIDEAVATRVRNGESVYVIDEEGLAEEQPDLVVTQSLCEVCAVATGHVDRALERLSRRPQVVTLHPHTLHDILEDIARVGEATARVREAGDLVAALKRRIDSVRQAAAGAPRPSVACLEWYDPLYSAGHWVPEMVEIAGGRPLLAQTGQPSARVDWRAVVEAAPDVLVLMPCGYDAWRALDELPALTALPGWDQLPAVRSGQVWAVNAHAYFNRPGPRIVDGLEVLAWILHPDRFAPPGDPGAAARAVVG